MIKNSWKKAMLIMLITGSAAVLSGCQNQQAQILKNDEDLKLTGQPLGSKKTTVSKQEKKPSQTEKQTQTITAVMKTEAGDITLKLMPEKAPQTVTNFVKKAKTGFYENLIFHRVEDWVVQGGDPKGDGTGGGTMPTELNELPFQRGSLGVARGADIKISNDSQFFICTKDCSWLTGKYTNFGQVVKGMEAVDRIKPGDKIVRIEIKQDNN